MVKLSLNTSLDELMDEQEKKELLDKKLSAKKKARLLRKTKKSKEELLQDRLFEQSKVIEIKNKQEAKALAEDKAMLKTVLEDAVKPIETACKEINEHLDNLITLREPLASYMN